MSPRVQNLEKQYEPVIDGLRAVAVLIVLFYHADIYPFLGGFIGVDIFFVISGYLITRNILYMREKGQFSFTEFYIRRTLRIFPAMFVTMVVTFITGIFLLSPVHLQGLTESTMYASVGLANFFFWKEAGYWDISKNFKPLLHFWSLAVEEQFYFLWPALIVGLLGLIKKQAIAKLGLVLFLISFLSLYLSQMLLNSESETSFYMMPCRIFEFGIGAGILWLRQDSNHTKVLHSALSATGLATIFYTAIFYSENTLFPGIQALLPCLGAALVIYSRNSPLVKMILGNKIMVGIGLISYSLYLVHWPLFIFYKYIPTNPDSHLVTLTLILSSIGLAYLMFRYVESPFRRLRNPDSDTLPKTPVFLFVAGLSAALISACYIVIKQDSVIWYTANKDIVITSADLKKMGADVNRLEIERIESHFFDKHPSKFVIIGDSYARDIFNALEYNGVKHPINLLTTQAGCLPLIGDTPAGSHPEVRNEHDQKKCRDTFMNILNSSELKQAEVIMIAAHWYSFGLGRFSGTIEEIKKRTDAPVIVFGHKMMHRGNISQAVTRYGYKDGLDEYINKTMDKEKSTALNTSMKNEVDGAGALYVDIISIFCPALKCPILLEDGSISTIDDGHWSLEGAKIFGLRFKNSDTAAARLLFSSKSD